MKKPTIATGVSLLAVALAVPAFAITFTHPRSITHIPVKSDFETVKGRTILHLNGTSFTDPDLTIQFCFEPTACTSFGDKIYGLRPDYYRFTKCGDETHSPQHVYRVDFVPYTCPAPGSELAEDMVAITYVGTTSVHLDCGDLSWTPTP